MTRPLDVLVLEHRRGNALGATDALERAGHRIHRCHAPGEPSFPCRGVADPAGCPLEGPIDVVLVVRPHVHPNPSALEDGVACAIRAGVPVVEDGSSILDPFEPWVTARVTDGAVADAVERAAVLGHAPLAEDIVARCTPVLAALGIDQSQVTCRIELDWPQLQVHVDVPGPLAPGEREALAVRAMDAVRASRRSYHKVDVQVHEEAP